MFRLKRSEVNELITSSLFDERTFYSSFINDLLQCEEEVIIESPFITSGRMKTFTPVFRRLLDQGVMIYVITRDPNEHRDEYAIQAEREVTNFEVMGIQTLLCTGNHHRKLAILDRKILWEGSLNILSQTNSREIMRRIESKELAMQMFSFLKLEKFI